MLTPARACLYCIFTHPHRYSSYRPLPVSKLCSVSHPHTFPTFPLSFQFNLSMSPIWSFAKEDLPNSLWCTLSSPFGPRITGKSDQASPPSLPFRVAPNMYCDWVQPLSNGTVACECPLPTFPASRTFFQASHFCSSVTKLISLCFLFSCLSSCHSLYFQSPPPSFL